MAIYFIHIDNGNGLVKDEDGQDFRDFAAARHHAIRSGADIIGDELTPDVQTVKLTLYIEDQEHRLLATLPMTASMECVTLPDDRLAGDIATVPFYP